jgi:hypothetical protein
MEAKHILGENCSEDFCRFCFFSDFFSAKLLNGKRNVVEKGRLTLG